MLFFFLMSFQLPHDAAPLTPIQCGKLECQQRKSSYHIFAEVEMIVHRLRRNLPHVEIMMANAIVKGSYF